MFINILLLWISYWIVDGKCIFSLSLLFPSLEVMTGFSLLQSVSLHFLYCRDSYFISSCEFTRVTVMDVTLLLMCFDLQLTFSKSVIFKLLQTLVLNTPLPRPINPSQNFPLCFQLMRLKTAFCHLNIFFYVACFSKHNF